MMLIKEAAPNIQNVFDPPISGDNIENQSDDWNYNYYSEIKRMPKFGIRYEPVQVIK